MELVIRGFLNPFTGDALAEIALWIEKAYADERQTEVAGLFAVIAGENAEATGVDRQGFV